jgi:nucleotide-binding universal stress UspA family protein
MYARILVALDGSEMAERILPHVEPPSRALGSTLIVLRATMSPEAIVAELNGGAMLPAAGIIDPEPISEAEREEVDIYVTKFAEGRRASGLTVQVERSDGPAADAILRRADELGMDLIAMTTHGRTGLGRLIFVSVAGDVLHRSTHPLLLVRVIEHAARSQDPPR